MSSLAIPSAPPPATANPDSGTAPATADRRFGDTLRQTQTAAEPRSDGDSPPAAGKSAKQHNPDAGTDPQQDDQARKDAQGPAGMVPAIPAVPVPVRQPPAAGGKPLPTAAPAATVKDIADARAAPAAMTAVPAQTAMPARAPVSGATPPTDAEQAPVRDAKLPAANGDGNNPGPPHDGLDEFAAQLTHLAAPPGGPAPAPQQAPPPAQLTMQSTPRQQPQFAQETAQHVSWLAGQNLQQARIQLNPRELGPIHVEITTHHDRVDVSFAVQHPQTVHALQQTLPQLHDMLAQQGLNLGQASVGQQAPGQQHAAFAQHAGGDGARGGTGNIEPDASPNWRPMRAAIPGRVDDFA